MNKIIFLICFFTSACSYRHIKDEAAFTSSEVKGNSSFEKNKSITYATINKSILLPKCVKCHSDSGGNQGGLNLERYDDVARAINSINQRTIIDKTMPPSRPLSNDEILLLSSWVSKGAPLDTSNSGANPNTPTKPTVTWLQVKNEVFAVKCIQCHSPSLDNSTPDSVTTMEAGLNLNDYEMVKSKADVILKRLIVLNDMPLKPYSPLSSSEKKLIVDWMMQGMYNEELENKKDDENNEAGK